MGSLEKASTEEGSSGAGPPCGEARVRERLALVKTSWGWASSGLIWLENGLA